MRGAELNLTTVNLYNSFLVCNIKIAICKFLTYCILYSWLPLNYGATLARCSSNQIRRIVEQLLDFAEFIGEDVSAAFWHFAND